MNTTEPSIKQWRARALSAERALHQLNDAAECLEIGKGQDAQEWLDEVTNLCVETDIERPPDFIAADADRRKGPAAPHERTLFSVGPRAVQGVYIMLVARRDIPYSTIVDTVREVDSEFAPIFLAASLRCEIVETSKPELSSAWIDNGRALLLAADPPTPGSMQIVFAQYDSAAGSPSAADRHSQGNALGLVVEARRQALAEKLRREDT